MPARQDRRSYRVRGPTGAGFIWRARAGASTAEYLLVIAVVVVGVVAAAQVFMGGFSAGVAGLSLDIQSMLSLEDGAGPDRGGGGQPGDHPGGAPLPPIEDPDDGSVPSLPDGSTAEQPPPAPPGDSAADTSGDSPGDSGDSADQEDDSSDETCPYVFDEASDRWRDPETGQYVSFDDATAAGC